MQDRRFLDTFTKMAERFEEEQANSLAGAAAEMKRTVKEDRLLYVFGGGGHTTLVMQELFWRAGGLANICPMIDFAIHPVTPAYMYLGHERRHGIGDHLVRYYGIGEGDVVLVFHSYGFNPPTIDCAMEVKRKGAIVIGISSSEWQQTIPRDFHLRHESGKNLFDVADISLDNYVPFGDTILSEEGFGKSFTGISSTIDFYIAHRLEAECIKACLKDGVEPPVWSSANVEGGDVANEELRRKYNPRVKAL